MTTGDDAARLFGLTDSFPCPAWVVLDAAREHRFTGELAFDVISSVRIYLDQGRIYLAERAGEPPLGARLVDTGVINAEQLQHGAIQVGDDAHLGRLFERVPSVDRDTVMLMTEMMNDECVAWIARHDVAAVASTPYLHHPSGIHRWDRPVDAVDLKPGDPLPAPPPTAAPVDVAPPSPARLTAETDTDSLVAWDQPAAPSDPAVDPAPTPEPALEPPTVEVPIDRSDSILESDWADRLETHGLPPIGSDPLAAPAPLPPLRADQRDRFELIWPSGEIDEEFDSTAIVDRIHDRDHDRVGPTARVVRSAEFGGEPELSGTTETIELWDFETTAPSFAPIEPALVPADTQPDLTVITDDAVLSMRRAVEAIETEALAIRRAPATTERATSGITEEQDIVVPGRVATRTESSLWSVRGFETSTTRSVFDEVAPTPVAEIPETAPTPQPAADTDPDIDADVEPVRVSALRRLIGGLRRR